MAKKKKKKRRKKSRPKNPTVVTTDLHHIFYQRRHWNKGVAYDIRKMHYCIVPVPRATLHRTIHEYVGDIPVPSEESAERVYAQLKLLKRYGLISDSDSVERRLQVLITLFGHSDKSTADALEKQLEIVHEFYEGLE